VRCELSVVTFKAKNEKIAIPERHIIVVEPLYRQELIGFRLSDRPLEHGSCLLGSSEFTGRCARESTEGAEYDREQDPIEHWLPPLDGSQTRRL
jgi:hypothetical protein